MPAMSSVQEAKPTVRLRYPDGTYKETQEGDTFEAHGGKPEDLMNEERWLSTPNNSGRTWNHTKLEESSPRGLRGITPDQDSRDVDGLFSDRIIWSPRIPEGSDDTTPRKVESQHIAFKHVPRACNVHENNGENLVFVGISAIDCSPVIIERVPSGECQDALDGIYFVSQGYRGCFTDARETILLENMMIPGNIAYIRSALLNRLESSPQGFFSRVMRRENNLLRRGLDPTGIALSLPSDQDSSRLPSICRPIHPDKSKTYDTLHFKLKWPAMAVLEFPSEMIKAVDQFLHRHPFDNVPLNIALAAAIIFMDLSNEGWKVEGFMADRNLRFRPIKPPSLGEFVLYFPHMLRYVETKHLTAFIHPARFATTHYKKGDKHDKDIAIDSTAIDVEKMKVWHSQIRSRYPQVPSSYRFNLIPASMPGSRLLFPSDCTGAEPPTTDLFRMCCLDDIQTLGLPSYHYSNHNNNLNGGRFRLIGGPEWLFCKRNQSHDYYLHGTAAVDYWRPRACTRFMALTGQAKSVGPVFPDITSTYYIDNNDITRCVESHFGAYYTRDHTYCESLSQQIRSQRSAHTTELLRVVKHLKIPLDKVWESQETGYLTWNGKEGHLRQLKEQGKLKRIAEEKEVEPEPKRPRPSERRLDGTVKAKIEDRLGSAAAVSRDWEDLRVYLQGNNVTIHGVELCLNQLHNFFVSVTRTFDHSNAAKGTGNLDEVIRLTFRAAGLEPRLALAACENRLAWQKNMLTQLDHSTKLSESVQRTQTPQLTQSIQQNIEYIYELRPLKNGFLHALPYIKALSDSPLIQDQSALLDEIKAWLREEWRRDEA